MDRSLPLPPARVRTILRLALPPILCGALSGCYTYAPLSQGPAPRGEEVRAYLTAEGREHVGELLLPDRRWVEGTVVRHDAQGLVLRVRTASNPENPTRRSLEQNIPLGDEHVAVLEVREMDGLRTGLLVGIGAVAGGALLGKILAGSGEDTSGSGGGGGTDALIPVVPPPGTSSPPR